MSRLHTILQNSIRGCLLMLLGFILFYRGTLPQAMAQPEGFANIAHPIEILDGKNVIAEGSIISLKRSGYVPASIEADDDIVGVINNNPAVFYEQENMKNSYLVSGGVSYVLVDITNGPIKKGDYITSSTKPGVGVKATIDGKVVGKAIENYDGTNKTGKILAEIKPERVEINDYEANISGFGNKSNIGSTALRFFNIANVFALKDPSRAFRYILAILVALISIIFGFTVFGRVVVRGVEGMSRNPLAAKLIIFSIVINLILTVIISGLGILLALLIVVY